MNKESISEAKNNCVKIEVKLVFGIFGWQSCPYMVFEALHVEVSMYIRFAVTPLLVYFAV